MEWLQTSNVSISNGNIKYPIGKSIFAVNLPLKFFHAIANAGIGSLKSLHILKKCFYHMLLKFQQNRMVQTTRNFELFDEELFCFVVFFWPFLTKRWRYFGRRSCSWNNCLMLNYWFPDYHLSVFQRLR